METGEGLLHGRVTTDDGEIYQGRLRWGADEEALWSNYFNGVKDGNPWIAYVPSARLPEDRPVFEIFGIGIGRESAIDLTRPFMVPFGNIARLDARGRALRVTLTNGTVVDLNRFAADDFADGVRIWDPSRGVFQLAEGEIRTIEFFAAGLQPASAARVAANPLYGTVRTRHGDFTGLIQWDREESLGSDELDGRAADGELSLRFDRIHSIARHASSGSLVTLLDGREILMSGTRNVGEGNRGVYVDDPRYGRVLIPWGEFERVEFSRGSAPAYGAFAPGRPLTGTVLTRSGRRLAGALVYDLDESETTETLDAPAQGLHYILPFGSIASIALPGINGGGVQHAGVTLRGGEELQLELRDDLGAGNAGMLIFQEGRQQPGYVTWADIQQVDFDDPAEVVAAHDGAVVGRR